MNSRIAIYCFSALLFGLSSMATFTNANDISVTIIRNDVVVTGDRFDNQIRIQLVAGRVHSFTGLGDTTINGSSESILLPINDDLVIRTNDGNDRVEIRSARIQARSHADLEVKLGRGKDSLVISNARIRRIVDLETDAIVETSGPLPKLPIIPRMPSEKDFVDIRDTDFEQIQYTALEGSDELEMHDCSCDFADIFCTEGNDTLIFRDCNIDAFELDSGPGNDLVYLGGCHFIHLFVFDTGTGDDVLHMFDNTLTTGANITESRLGRGDDTLFGWNNFYGNRLWWTPITYNIDGGQGFDRVFGGETAFFSDWITYTRVEFFDPSQILDTFFFFR